MSLLLIKLIIDLCAGILNAMGGFHWLFCRRFIMPVLIGIGVSFFSHVWWLGLTCLGAIITLSIGYGKGGNAWRGVWLFMQAVAFTVFVVIFKHLSWWFEIPFVVIAGILGGIYRNWPQIIGDIITGTYLASFIFLIK